MPPTLGEKLRQARQDRGISISEVAEQTRISPLYLESIENDNYKPLPGGIFNKGFLKSYARYVGFDESEALREYSQMVTGSDGEIEHEPRPYRSEVLTEDGGRSQMPTYIFAGLILAGMTVGLLLAVRYWSNRPPPSPNVASTNAVDGTNVNVTTQPQSADAGAPDMSTLKVEFSTSSEPISLSSNVDAKPAIQTVTADKPATFEPRQALRISYAKSLAAAARLTINGRSIALPQSPANPKRIPIEIEINRENISQIWKDGAVAAYAPPSPNRPAVAPTPLATKPAAANAAPKVAPAANAVKARP